MIDISSIQFSKQPDYKQLVSDGAWVIDVRTPEEFASGHFNGSTNIPLDTIADEAASIRSRNKIVITVCRSGARSNAAAEILRREGVEVFNGGGWTDFARMTQ